MKNLLALMFAVMSVPAAASANQVADTLAREMTAPHRAAISASCFQPDQTSPHVGAEVFQFVGQRFLVLRCTSVGRGVLDRTDEHWLSPEFGTREMEALDFEFLPVPANYTAQTPSMVNLKHKPSGAVITLGQLNLALNALLGRR